MASRVEGARPGEPLGSLVRDVPRWLLVAGLAAGAAALNVLLGAGAAMGQKPLLLVVVLGLLPAALVAFGALIESHRALLAWIALSINLTGLPILVNRLPLPGGTSIYLTDILVLLAVGAWLASRLSGRPSGRVKLSAIFSWPLALFAVAMVVGVAKGHERYGASIVGQPLRILLYAGIALALMDATPTSAWKAITRVFYAGAVVQALYAAYYLETGGSQTQSESLSTGGTRILALSVAIYLTGSMICALLNIELERQPIRQLGHAAIAGLALFGIVVSFGRSTYAAVVLIVPLLLATRRYMRRTVLLVLPLFAPVIVLAALSVSAARPDLVSTLQDRVQGTSSNDLNVRWRERAVDVTLEGVHDEWLTGVGFGRTSRFELDGRIYTIHDDPHNSFVYLLAGGGVLALGSFLLLGLLYVGDAIRRLLAVSGVEQVLVVWALGTWLAFMVNAFAGPVLPDPTMMLTIWVLFALPSVVPLSGTTEEAATKAGRNEHG